MKKPTFPDDRQEETLKFCNVFALVLIVTFFIIGIHTEIDYENENNPYLIALAFLLFLIAMYILSKCQTK